MAFRELTGFALFARDLIRLRARPAQVWNAARLAFDYFIRGHRTPTLGTLPTTISIYINMKCNLRCDFCYYDWNDHSYVTQHINVRRYEELLGAPIFSKALRMVIGGGEPLLHPKYCELVELATRRHLYTVTHTNGLLIERILEKLSATPLNSLNVSIYDDHEDEQFRQIALLLEANRRRRNPMRISICRIVSAQTFEDMDRIMARAQEAGIKYVFFQNYYDGPNLLSDKPIYESNTKFQRYAEEFRQRHRRSGVRYILPEPLKTNRLAQGRCISVFGSLSIDSLGNISPCCFIAPPSRQHGNILEEKDPWNNEFYLGIRKAMLDPQARLDGACSTCSLLGNNLIKFF